MRCKNAITESESADTSPRVASFEPVETGEPAETARSAQYAETLPQAMLHEHRISRLEERIMVLEQMLPTIVFNAISQLGDTLSIPSVVPINTFAPEPYTPENGMIYAVVARVEDGYVASVHDVNVGASGATVLEAVEHLKELLIFTLEDLNEESPDRLGARAKSQLHALRALIRRNG